MLLVLAVFLVRVAFLALPGVVRGPRPFSAVLPTRLRRLGPRFVLLALLFLVAARAFPAFALFDGRSGDTCRRRRRCSGCGGPLLLLEVELGERRHELAVAFLLRTGATHVENNVFVRVHLEKVAALVGEVPGIAAFLASWPYGVRRLVGYVLTSDLIITIVLPSRTFSTPI